MAQVGSLRRTRQTGISFAAVVLLLFSAAIGSARAGEPSPQDQIVNCRDGGDQFLPRRIEAVVEFKQGLLTPYAVQEWHATSFWFWNILRGDWDIGTNFRNLDGPITPGPGVIPLRQVENFYPVPDGLRPTYYWVTMGYKWWYAYPGDTQWSTLVFWQPTRWYLSETGVARPNCNTYGETTDIVLGRPVERFAALATSSRSPAPRGAEEQCLGRAPTLLGTNGPDVLNGTADTDVIQGAGGGDTISGRGGQDFICGGDGSDRINGGAGDDIVFAGNHRDRVNGGTGVDLIEGGKGPDIMRGGANTGDGLAYVSENQGVHVNFATGRADDGSIDSFSGFDTVAGSFHNDVLVGARGAQWFVPLGGRDSVKGGRGSDVVLYTLAEQGVVVDLDTGVATGEGRDRLTSIQVIVGSSFDDHIFGDDLPNYILGWDGNDELLGGPGRDTIVGGNGNEDACFGAFAYEDCENQGGGGTVLPNPPTPPSDEQPPDR